VTTAVVEEVIEGLVLCRVGEDRLAVRANEVTAFEIPHEGAPYAGVGFVPGAVAPAEGKLLRHHDSALVVDSVEVHAERLKLLAVPAMLRASARVGAAQAWGGALSGFVEVGGLLWPVLSLQRFTEATSEAVILEASS
jgi:hypothetical protein